MLNLLSLEMFQPILWCNKLECQESINKMHGKSFSNSATIAHAKCRFSKGPLNLDVQLAEICFLIFIL